MISIEKPTRRDWLWPAVFLALGVIGAIVARQFFFQAFPEASIDLKLTREQIAEASDQLLRGRGLSPTGFRRVTLFDFDDQAKTYLEREMGLEEANRVMMSRFELWRWRTRWIKPPEKEEFSVWLTTRGKLAGFEHQVEEKKEGAKLSKGEAQRIAEIFLRAERGVDLARYRLVTDDLKERPKRFDYTFTWEENGVRFKDATVRLSVTVLGDQVGGFKEFLKIPEQWTRDYERLRSRNGVLEVIATALYVLLCVAAIVTLVRGRRRLPFKALLVLSSVVGALFMANFWNEFSLASRVMPTNITPEAFTTFYLVGMALIGILVTAYVLTLAAAGEPLYRELQPKRIALNHLFGFRGLRSKEFFTSTLIGYGMAGMHIGLVTLFYVMARRLGAWAPLDVNYNDAISTPMPWLSPLSTSMFASSTEEFAFRLLAIPLLLRWTRSKWVAILVPAFMWGFLHSSYPQQPPWIRGVEVGAIGVVAGWVYLRFGILATLVWHYTVDAVLIGMFLLRSENLTYRMAGALVGDAVLVPLVIGGVFYLQSRGFLRDDRILNDAPEEEAPPEAEALERPAAPPRTFAFVTRARLATLALLGLAGVVALAVVQVPHAGDKIDISAGPKRAEAAAVAQLKSLGVPVASYQRVTWLEDDFNEAPVDYVFEFAGMKRLQAIARDTVPLASWRTRFFRSLKKEEYSVYVAPDGKVTRFTHQLDEKAKGAQLEKPEALDRATRFLESGGLSSLAGYQLMEHELERRDARNDHTLTWEANQKLVRNAAHRVTVAVKGDEATGPRHFIKVPEEWSREHTRPTFFTVLPVLLIVGLALAGAVFFATAMPRAQVRWRAHVGLGVAASCLQLIQFVNSIPRLGESYTTSVPYESQLLIFFVSGLMSVIFSGAGVAVLAAAADTLLGERFGRLCLWPDTASARGRALLEALAIGVLGALFVLGARTLIDAGQESIATPVRGVQSGLPRVEPQLLPALSLVTNTLFGALWSTLLLAGLVGVVTRVLRNRGALVFGLLAGTALASAAAFSPLHFVKEWAGLAVYALLLASLISWIGFNPATYLVFYVTLSGLPKVLGMWRHEGLRPIAEQGGAILVTLLVIVAALGVLGLQSGERKSPISDSGR